VLTAGGTAERLRRKGYGPALAPESLVNAAGRYGLPSPAKVLSADDRSGREVPAASPDAQAAVDLVLELLEEVGLTNGKGKPPVKCFTSILNGGVMLNGYYRDGEEGRKTGSRLLLGPGSANRRPGDGIPHG
jgi:hypothetical protein